MRRLTALASLLAVAALLPAPAAHAAALGELPPQPLDRAAVATCLRATGTPGELALYGTRSGSDATTDLRSLGEGGSVVIAGVRLGRLADCAAVATDPGGAAIVAAPIWRFGERTEVRAVVRDGGAAFGPVARLGRADLNGPQPAVAISPGGHAVVAWAQRRGPSLGPDRYRIVAARRAPGEGFGPVETLTPWRAGDTFGSPDVAAGIDASGAVTLAWARPEAERGGPSVRTMSAAIAVPGAPFAKQRLESHVEEDDDTSPALSVAPDGWALLAYASYRGVRAFERPPGAPRFTRVLAARVEAQSAVVAVRSGGGGVVAWRSGFSDAFAGVMAVARPGAGTFAAPRVVAGSLPPPGGAFSGVVAAGDADAAPLDQGNATLRAALAADGRTLLAWTTERRLTGARTLHAASGTLEGGFGAPGPLGGVVRDVNGVAPLFLSDGRAAVAWTDNAGREIATLASGHGRLSAAVESFASAPRAPNPRLRVRAARTQRLFEYQPIRVTAECDRACDLRATVTGAREVASTYSLPRAGRIQLQAQQLFRRPRPRLRIVVRAAAPGGRAVTRRVAHVRVLRRPPRPAPVPLGVRASRRGDDVVVTWRTAKPARNAYFLVEGRRRRTRRDFGVVEYVRGRGRTRFSVRFVKPGGIRWIGVWGTSLGGAQSPTPVVVRVRGEEPG